MKKNKFISLLAVFIILVPITKTVGQNKIVCEITMTNNKQLSKDSIFCNELFIDKNEETIFSWFGYTIVRDIGNKKEVFCILVNPILDKIDTFRHELKVLAIIHLDTLTCELRKEILASQLQSKQTKDLLAEYTVNKKLYKKNTRINKGKSKGNYLLRYCYDLAYAAIAGDSLATERLLTLNKDFKLFRDGLDAEDLTYLRNYLYDLVIIEKPIKYRERYRYLSLIRY